MSESRDLILSLRSQGYSNRAIARAIGRNDSLISQIARGIKPGGNLTESLRELSRRPGVSTDPVAAAPPRRTTRSGEVARVRGGRPAAARTTTRAPSPTAPTRGTAVTAAGTATAWEIAGFATSGGSGRSPEYVDLEKNPGAAGRLPDRGDVWITVKIGKDKYRQAYVFLTDSFSIADAVQALVEQYGDDPR